MFQENLRAFKTISVQDLAIFLLFFIGSRALDPNTHLLFEGSIPQSIIYSLEDSLNCVQHRLKILENLHDPDMSENRTNKGNKSSKFALSVTSSVSDKKGATSSSYSTSSNVKKCIICNRNSHPLYVSSLPNF